MMWGAVVVTVVVDTAAAAVEGTNEGDETFNVVGTGDGNVGTCAGVIVGVGPAAVAEVTEVTGGMLTALTAETRDAMATAVSRAFAASRAAWASRYAAGGGAICAMCCT